MSMYSKKGTLIFSPKVLERFMNKIEIPENKDNCWEWTGARDGGGYGNYETSESQTYRVHRIMYELHYRKIKPKMVIDHICCNKLCVNPEHLKEETNEWNAYYGNSILKHKGFCKYGHKMDPDNIYITPSTGSRRCRKCLNMYHPEFKDEEYALARTHCKYGHKYTKENTYWYDGYRHCRECRRISKNVYENKNKN